MKHIVAVVIISLLGETCGFAIVQSQTSRPQLRKLLSVTPKTETETETEDSFEVEEAYLEVAYEGFFDGTKVSGSFDTIVKHRT